MRLDPNPRDYKTKIPNHTPKPASVCHWISSKRESSKPMKMSQPWPSIRLSIQESFIIYLYFPACVSIIPMARCHVMQLLFLAAQATICRLPPCHVLSFIWIFTIIPEMVLSNYQKIEFAFSASTGNCFKDDIPQQRINWLCKIAFGS